jgi:hypothetical protein
LKKCTLRGFTQRSSGGAVTRAPALGANSVACFACLTSTIDTPKLAEAAFPRRSEALQVTVVAPTGKVVPDAGKHVTATAPSTTSVALAE